MLRCFCSPANTINRSLGVVDMYWTCCKSSLIPTKNLEVAYSIGLYNFNQVIVMGIYGDDTDKYIYIYTYIYTYI